MSHEPDTLATATRRIDALDIARGIALLAMAVFHFTWDLDNFGYVARGLAGHGGWRIFARCIASSFLFLVGFSLVLAHARGIRWKPFLVRLAQVAAGAVAITVATLFVTPGSFVFFGILHHIALASLLGLLFLRWPPFATAALALVAIALPNFVATPLADPKALAWIGIAAKAPVSNDFVPIFPWFGAVLLGIAAAGLARRLELLDRLRDANARLIPLAPLAWLGRHSLAFYLIHQPVLFGLVFLATQIAPPDRTALLERECREGAFLGERSDALCPAFAACTAADLAAIGLLERTVAGTPSPQELGRIQAVANACAQRQP